MIKFDDILNKQYKKYGLLSEEDAAQQAPESDVALAPAQPSADASPTPQQGATPEAPSYDKPYMDLARILYQALRLDFDELETILQNRILNLKPDDIKSDKQAVSIFREVENILSERSGVAPSDEGFGPAANNN